MIGIIITFLIISQTYKGFQQQNEILQSIQSSESLYKKIIEPSNPCIKQGSIIDYIALNSTESLTYIDEIHKQYCTTGMNFSLYFSFENTSFWYPKEPVDSKHRIAVTHTIPLEINHMKIIAAKISVILWNIEDEL